MRAHQIDANGLILRTIVVNSLADFPDLIDASIGGGAGDSVVNGELVPAPGPVAAVVRAERWEEIKALRDIKAQTGGYLAAGKWFHSDTFSRTQQLGLLLMGAGIPPGLQWKTMDGSFVAMTQTLASQIFAAAAAQDTALFAHAEALKAAVDASNSPANVDITSGWPETYTS